MVYKIMESNDAAKLAAFEKTARLTEPGVLFGEIEEEEYARVIKERMADPICSNTRVALALDGGRVVGRCDFTMKASIMDGFRDAYVDWIYVLKDYRHKRVGQGLIAFMEVYLKEHRIQEYFLFTAHNEEAQRFYTHFEGYKRDEDWVLRKEIQ